MGKNITIQEGGVAKQLTVDKLKTNLVGGGACLWVPENEVQLGTKTITANSTYNASDDGYYGYSQVIVNVPGGAGGSPGGPGSSVVGTDGDGDESVVSVDEDGNLDTEKVPSSIEVVTPPTNPYGIYQDGQSITTDGMVVKAYLQTGGEYGVVPNGEITLNPTTATYDSSSDVTELDGDGIHAYGYVPNTQYGYPNYAYYVYWGTMGASSPPASPADVPPESYPIVRAQNPNSQLFVTEYNGNLFVAANPPTSLSYHTGAGGGSTTTIGKNFIALGNSGSMIYEAFSGKMGTSTSNPAGISIDDLERSDAGSRQTINVSWPRPLDGKVLETTFEILVAPPIYGDSEN